LNQFNNLIKEQNKYKNFKNGQINKHFDESFVVFAVFYVLVWGKWVVSLFGL